MGFLSTPVLLPSWKATTAARAAPLTHPERASAEHTMDKDTAPADYQRNSMCPNCHDGRGLPFKLIAAPGQSTLSFRCPVCDHQWEVVSAIKPVIPMRTWR